MAASDIRKIAKRLIRKSGTNNPFEICRFLGIFIEYSDLGNVLGFFKCNRRQKFIYINNKLCSKMVKNVCAHELGHVLLHPCVNTVYLNLCTYVVVEKFENEANMLAAELLISDEDILEHKEKSIEAIASLLEVSKKLVEFKLKGLYASHNLNKKSLLLQRGEFVYKERNGQYATQN